MCKLRPELAAEAQQTAWSKFKLKSSEVKLIYFKHPSQGNSTYYYIILGPRDKSAPPTSQQIKQIPPKRVKKRRHRHPFFFFFLPHPQESSLCYQPIRGKVRRTGRIFPEHAERSFSGNHTWLINSAAGNQLEWMKDYNRTWLSLG